MAAGTYLVLVDICTMASKHPAVALAGTHLLLLLIDVLQAVSSCLQEIVRDTSLKGPFFRRPDHKLDTPKRAGRTRRGFARPK